MSSSRTGSRPRYGKKAASKVGKAMHEMKRGTLRSGRSKKKVTDPKQAIAIGLSQARRAGGKVPPAKRTTKTSTRTRRSVKSAAKRRGASASRGRTTSQSTRRTATSPRSTRRVATTTSRTTPRSATQVRARNTRAMGRRRSAASSNERARTKRQARTAEAR